MKWAILVLLSVPLLACGGDTEDAEAVEPNGETESQQEGENDTNGDQNDANDDGNQGGGASGVNPRWVLYDADDNPVEAIVSPGHRPSTPQEPGIEWDRTEFAPNCVSVEMMGDDFPRGVAIPYELSTGEISSPCLPDHSQNVVRFTDVECEGQPFARASAASYVILEINNSLLWPEGETFEVDPIFMVDNEGECTESYSAELLLPLEPVPDDVVNALPNPPYEIRAEY